MQGLKIIRWINWLAIFLVIGTPLFYIKKSVYPYTFSKTLFLQAVIELIFFLWLILAITDKKYRPKLKLFSYGVLVFLGVLFLTSVLGEDFSRSFWSTQERNLGIFTFLHLGALFFIFSSIGKEIQWKKIFYCSFATSILVTLIGFIQLSKPNILLNESVGGGTRPGSSFGNPTFLAGYLLLHVFLAIYFFLKNREEVVLKQKKQNPWEVGFILVSFGVNFAGIFLTQTRGDILGLGLGIFAFIVFLAVRPLGVGGWLGKRYFYVCASVVILLLGTTFWFTKANSFWASVPGLNRFQDVSLTDKSLQPRLIALQSAWKGFKDKPVFGWGFENFNLAYNKYYDPRALELGYQETRFDKPHNLFFEFLVTGGVLLVLAFGFLMVSFLRALFKNKDKPWRVTGLAILVAYLVRSFFVFDTVGPVLMLYLVFAYTFWLEIKGTDFTQQKNESGHVIKTWVWALNLTLAIVLIYTLNFKPALASYNQYWGFINFVNGKSELAIQNFRKAVEAPTPYSYYFKRDYATALAENYFYQPENIDSKEVLKAVEAMEAAMKEHPKDAYNHYVLADLYNQVSDLDPSRLLPLSEKEARIALELSPGRQQVYFTLAKTKHLQGEKEEAIEIVKDAIALNPNIPDAHFYYGVLSYDFGDTENGYRELKKAIEMGRAWKNYYEMLTVANFFADSGHLDEALELYKKAAEKAPNDLEIKAKLGAAYYFLGMRDLAKKEFQEVLSKFDISKSPSYLFYDPILRNLGLMR